MSSPPLTGFNLWWARNDGMSGHAWLSVRDMALLRDEMAAQGMTADGIPTEKLEAAEGQTITPAELARGLVSARPEPLTAVDEKLWRDWLAFLEGGSRNGGILIR